MTLKLKSFILLLFCFLYNLSFGQIPILENSTYKIYNNEFSDFSLRDTLNFSKSPTAFSLPKYSTIRLKFNLTNRSNTDSIFYLNCKNQGYVKLYQINNNALNLLAETGHTCPYYKRSIRDEISFIKLHIKKGISQRYLLEVKNYNIEYKDVSFQINDYAQYQEIKLAQKSNFVNKYGQPIFLGIVALILLITLIQLLMFRERIYFIYLLYIIFILLRVAMSISLLVVENYITVLREFGFISRFSQTFSFLSIIAYLFFIREFVQSRLKNPLFDKFLKLQILFMVLYMIAELFVVVEKYTVPLYINIHNGFELIEAILGIITIFGLFKVYDKQNKFLVWGVVFLFLVAFVGQQIMLRISTLSRLEQDLYLQVLWGIAYLGEMVFFTLGLFNRAVIMKQTIELQALENQKLNLALNESQGKEISNELETLNIATTRGTIIIQQADIFRVEASGNYTVFYVNNQKQVMASSTMSEFENKLINDRFIRVHKSHIVNLRFVVKYTKGDGGSLTLQDGSEIPVSRSRKEELIKKLFPGQ